MKVLLVGPRPDGPPGGNHVTVERWARIFEQLGHRPHVAVTCETGDWDLMVALHAGKSAEAVGAFHDRFPDRPVVMALTGTDLYPNLSSNPEALRAVETAERIVVLQPAALDDLPPGSRARARVIYQSEVPAALHPGVARTPPAGNGKAHFEVCVVAHLRAIKDPLCAACAARRLPEASRIRVTLIGGILERELESPATKESETNPRFRWLGPIPRAEALARLAASDLLVSTSLLEGGANAVSEAVVNGVPVLATRIPGSVGLLGDEYPGYFEVGNDAELADLMYRAETDSAFLGELTERCGAQQHLFTPEEESRRWAELLRELEHEKPAER